MLKFLSVVATTISLWCVSVSPCAASESSIPFAPFVSYGVSEQGTLFTAGSTFGDDFIRIAAAASYFEGAEKNYFNANNTLEFTNFDVSVRFGKFSTLSVYGEVGIALDELIFDDLFDGDDNNYDWGTEDDSQLPDPFIGIAAGFEQAHWSVSAFARYRYLPSYEDELRTLAARSHTVVTDIDVHQIFSGVEFSLRF